MTLFVVRIPKWGLRTSLVYNTLILNIIQKYHVRTPRRMINSGAHVVHKKHPFRGQSAEKQLVVHKMVLIRGQADETGKSTSIRNNFIT